MRYLLSKLIPMRFTSIYGVSDIGRSYYERSTWWQWRDRIWWHHKTELA